MTQHRDAFGFGADPCGEARCLLDDNADGPAEPPPPSRLFGTMVPRRRAHRAPGRVRPRYGRPPLTGPPRPASGIARPESRRGTRRRRPASAEQLVQQRLRARGNQVLRHLLDTFERLRPGSPLLTIAEARLSAMPSSVFFHSFSPSLPEFLVQLGDGAAEGLGVEIAELIATCSGRPVRPPHFSASVRVFLEDAPGVGQQRVRLLRHPPPPPRRAGRMMLMSPVRATQLPDGTSAGDTSATGVGVQVGGLLRAADRVDDARSASQQLVGQGGGRGDRRVEGNGPGRGVEMPLRRPQAAISSSFISCDTAIASTSACCACTRPRPGPAPALSAPYCATSAAIVGPAPAGPATMSRADCAATSDSARVCWIDLVAAGHRIGNALDLGPGLPGRSGHALQRGFAIGEGGVDPDDGDLDQAQLGVLLLQLQLLLAPSITTLRSDQRRG